MVEQEGELLAIEVKTTKWPSYRDAVHMRAFLDEYGGRVRGALLLHAGSETFWITEKVLATPGWRVLLTSGTDAAEIAVCASSADEPYLSFTRWGIDLSSEAAPDSRLRQAQRGRVDDHGQPCIPWSS